MDLPRHTTAHTLPDSTKTKLICAHKRLYQEVAGLRDLSLTRGFATRSRKKTKLGRTWSPLADYCDEVG